MNKMGMKNMYKMGMEEDRRIYKLGSCNNINLSPQYDLLGNAGFPFLFGGYYG